MTLRNSMEMLSFCLQWSMFKVLPILFDVDDDDSKLAQVKQFAMEISTFITRFKITENQLDKIKWYDPTMVAAALSATTWEELRRPAKQEEPNELEEQYCEEDIEDAKSNMPCDTWGMLACTSSCPQYEECQLVIKR